MHKRRVEKSVKNEEFWLLDAPKNLLLKDDDINVGSDENDNSYKERLVILS